ncbi:MAG TPA: hypothetical protein VGG25_22850 [Streptosporangiaceae bacterium]|jgi:hypothetical protein
MALAESIATLPMVMWPVTRGRLRAGQVPVSGQLMYWHAIAPLPAIRAV